MQFLWKYADDLIGKGLEWYLVGELLFYASSSFVPLALPLAILLSSIMTMGGLGEQFELTALKASGISLVRIGAPLFIVSIVIGISSYLFSNYMQPASYLQFRALLYDVSEQKPALNIKPGVFYSGIDGYSMRIGKKLADNQTIFDVMIYDHTDGKGNTNVLIAKKGKMVLTDDKRFMILELFNGKQYQEITDNQKKDLAQEQARVSFDYWKKIFDLSDFKMTRTDVNLFKDNYEMMNQGQLAKAIDTFEIEKKNNEAQLVSFVKPYLSFLKHNLDSVFKKNNSFLSAVDSSLAYDKKTLDEKSSIINSAVISIRNIKGYSSFISGSQNSKTEMTLRYQIEWWRKITLAFACLLLFLIGAPLGAIIRKGGLGLPFVIAVVFFVFFYMVTVSGEKFAKEKVTSVFTGMWLSSLILLPIGIFLVRKATHDSKLFNLDAWYGILKKTAAIFNRRKSR
ncbi:hypothetical protein LBMAG27_01610 [Bacteroidota bacterium]|nr:hypothetical protein LBMAG27_01610 [Bacteroidota bacterium]